MADIVDLSGANAPGRQNQQRSERKIGAVADIIIFPGVRYERDGEDLGTPRSGKSGTRGKKVAKRKR